MALEIAKKLDGKCLSEKYINNRTKMHWECKMGHDWYARLDDIKNKNVWCQECGFLDASKKLNNSIVHIHWKTNEEIICVASYEIATVKYLNENKIEFEWQSKKFQTPFLTKTKKFKTYRPDLYLINEDKWIEIKGYFRDDDKEKWDWFHEKHPNSELWDKKKLKELGIL